MANFAASSFAPKGFKDWDDQEFNDRIMRSISNRRFGAAPGGPIPEELFSEALEGMYNDGFAGVRTDPDATVAFERKILGEGGDLDGERIVGANGLAGSGEGKLVAPFVAFEKLTPGGIPGPAQQRGSCVAHNKKNVILLTWLCEILSGLPDEVSGLVEALPDLDPVGILNGVLSTEALYWWRGYNGDGWTCEAAATVATTKSGLWLRKNYPDLGIDLRKYSGALEGKYGAKRPPEDIAEAGKTHLVRTATRVKTFEAVRDMLNNGYGISTCGSEGFSSTRDENGVSKRSGSWSHAMAFIGVDDRDLIKQIYGEPLVLLLNSWGKSWNRGPRLIRGTNISIPEGAFFARWSSVKNRSMLAMAGIPGFIPRRLPRVEVGVG